VAQQLRMLSLRPLADVEALLSEHTTAPEKRLAQRALADEVTELVHGAEAAATAREAADVLFGGDPLTASEAAIRAIAGEVPTTRVNSEQLADPVELLVATGLASSKGEARRLFDQRGIRANGVQLDANSLVSDVARLHERFVLLRKGKSTYHVVEISSPGG
jgi:tyrosyl-tRNA synthetase